MSNNLFLISLDNHAPWFIKNEPGKTVGDPQVFIRDQQDNAVCRINTRNRNAPNNARLISHAPQLLAALIEYAYNAHSAGWTIHDELIELIRDSGGPDLSGTLRK